MPVLLNLGPVTLSSFGVFLALALITSLYFIWKLALIEEIDEDQSTNLAILTFLASLIGARILAVVLNLNIFNSLIKILDLNRYPALSFWGGVLMGLLLIVFYCHYKKLNLWKILDLALIGAWIGIAIGDIGCFLGGCAYGAPSSAWFASSVSGLLGTRFPVSLVEGVVLLLLFPYLWKKAVRFHEDGSIFTKGLFIMGVLKLFLESYRGDRYFLYNNISLGQLLPILMIIGSLIILYTKLKRSILRDLRLFYQHFTSSKRRNLTLSQLQKSWYNQSVIWKIRSKKILNSLLRISRIFRRKLNVKPTPDQFR